MIALPPIQFDRTTGVLEGANAWERLAALATPLLGATPERARQVDAFARLDSIMEIGKAAPSARAAQIVLETLAHRKALP